jgi:hypothetical protein
MLNSRKYISIAMVGAALAVAASAPASAQSPNPRTVRPKHCYQSYQALSMWVYKRFDVKPPHPEALRSWRNEGKYAGLGPEPGQRYAFAYGHRRAYARMY